MQARYTIHGSYREFLGFQLLVFWDVVEEEHKKTRGWVLSFPLNTGKINKKIFVMQASCKHPAPESKKWCSAFLDIFGMFVLPGQWRTFSNWTRIAWCLLFSRRCSAFEKCPRIFDHILAGVSSVMPTGVSSWGLKGFVEFHCFRMYEAGTEDMLSKHASQSSRIRKLSKEMSEHFLLSPLLCACWFEGYQSWSFLFCFTVFRSDDVCWVMMTFMRCDPSPGVFQVSKRNIWFEWTRLNMT